MSEPLLQITGLSKSFGERAVLHRLDLSVQRGELVAIVGRSGCGKSTLLRLVAGLDAPSTGEIRVNGHPITGLNKYARLMFQDAALLPWRTALQNVALALPDRRNSDHARAALAHVGLGDRGDEWPSILSGGQRQRVALARALASGSDLILFDEPLGALDALTRLEMQDLIERLWLEEKFTAILITHDVEEAVALADRVFVMEEGVFSHEIPVRLPRPRQRGDAAFTALREHVLARVRARDIVPPPPANHGAQSSSSVNAASHI